MLGLRVRDLYVWNSPSEKSLARLVCCCKRLAMENGREQTFNPECDT